MNSTPQGKEEAVGIDRYPPAPLQYASRYTDENVQNAEWHDRLAPPVPIEGPYSVFGQPTSTNEPLITPLQQRNVQELPLPYNERRENLKYLLWSAVSAFLDLTAALTNAPDSPERQAKIEDIRTIFLNIHQLINEYRPIQARMNIEQLLEAQRNDRKKLIANFEQRLQLVRLRVQKCAETLTTDGQHASDG